MTKRKKRNLIIAFALFCMFILSGLVSAGFLETTVNVSAETAYFSAEEYTDSDWLLLPDGTESTNRKIGNFATDVKAGEDGMSFPEISQVVPLEYLESAEPTAEFAYNGNEYGFYMVKEGNYFDLLLIDFIYEFEDDFHSDLEYKIRIETILQSSFYRETWADGYRWKLVKTRQPLYYVANPRFMTLIRNENALNCGDPGYTKLTDDGLIILQSRLNYYGIKQKTDGDYLRVCAEFAGEKLLSSATDAAIKALDTVLPGSGTVISIMQDVVELSSALYEEGSETVSADNETDIFTRQSKDTQRNNNNNPGYSRYATFCPQTEVILTPGKESDEKNAYAEFIVLLNEANYRTRMYQQCDFDIITLSGSQISKDNKVSRRRVLFGEDSEKELAFQSTVPVYMLCNGTDKFIFNAEYASDYEIKLEWESIADVIVNGQNFGNVSNIKYYADSGEKILIETTTEEKVTIGTITISPNTGNTIDKIPAHESYILQKNLTGIKKLSTGNSGLKISQFCRLNNSELYDYTSFGGITPADEITYPFFENTYYIILKNTSANDFKSPQLSVSDIETLGIGGSNTVSLKSSNLNYFKIVPEKSGNHIITISNVAGTAFYYSLLTSDFGEGSGEPVGNGRYIARLTKGIPAYFGVKSNAEEVGAKISIEQTDSNYQWKISGGEFGSGETVSENRVWVTRGQIYTLSFWLNDINIDANIFTHAYVTSWGDYTDELTINDGRITIPSDCPLGGEIEVRAKASDDTSYDNVLYLIPTDQLSLNSVIIENSEKVTLRIQAPRYVSGIKFVIGYATKEVTKSITVSKNSANNSVVRMQSDEILNYIQTVAPSSMALVYFRITELHYYDALGNDQIDKTYTYTTSINSCFASGYGTSSSPYIINCARHLNNIRYRNGSYFQLVSDITYSDSEAWIAIPEFSGVFLGDGYEITYKNPSVPYGESYGFIKENHGTIESVYFKPTIKVRGKNSSDDTFNFGVGGAVGINYGQLYNVYVIETIADPYMNLNGGYNIDLFAEDVFSLNLGGVCGYNYGTLEDCYNYASIGGSAHMGGIVGLNYESAQLIGCKNYGNIYFSHANYANLCIAGVAATVRDKGRVENCGNYATITWAAWISKASYTKPVIARLVAQMCTSASDVNNYAGGRVVVSESIRLYLYDEQLEKVKDEKFAFMFDPPGSSSGGDDGGGCVALGTLITLANGTQVPVESLTGDELLLVWDMRTGTFGTAPILFIDSDPYGLYNVIYLSFSDGTSLKVITEHALWDYNLNRYIFMDENASQYIGHWFNKQSMGQGGQLISHRVQLIGVSISLEYSIAYSPVTYSYLCYYVNGMLSMPGATEGLINIFDVDSETLMYNTDAMAADIAKYGLFTYEEFVELIDVPREIFEAFNGQYLKVSLGKNLITLEYLQELVERYAEFFA